MKKYIIKWSIVGVVFFSALFIISSVMNKGNSDLTAEMAKATFPIVRMQYGDYTINELHGYGSPREVSYMRDHITPLAEGRRLSLQIDCFDRRVTSITYEVRSIDGSRLIENTTVGEYEQNNDKIELSFALKDLIEPNKEYILVLILGDHEGREIRYYTRVISSNEMFAAEKIAYVLDFSERTFDKEAAKELTKYLESNSEGDNTTLGRVTIHSSFQQVTWGSLRVKKVQEPILSLKELAAQTASMTLHYVVKEEGAENYYQIEEFYRVRYTADRMYLLDYERSMNQIFNEKKEVYGDKKIYIGIAGEGPQLLESDGGSVIAFVTGNRVYSYNSIDNKLAFLFGFYDENNADARTFYDKNDIKILNVDEGGNVIFMVYGYMNRGRHEGEVGISVSYYDSTVNTTEEMVYVPYRKSPEMLIAEVEQVTYFNRDGILYLMLDNQLLGINAENRSCEAVTRDLKEGCFEVSESNRMIVWQKEKELYQGTELILMNLSTGVQTSIKSGWGEAIAPIGFMGDDLIYGIARKRDVVPDNMGKTIFPMYCVRIENETEGIKKEYRQEDIYVTAGTVTDNQINLKRVMRKEDKSYTEIEDDQIMNAEVAAGSINYVERVAIEKYEKVTQIAVKEEIDKAGMKLLTPKEVLFEGGRNALPADSGDMSKRYYVYGKGKMAGIFMDEGNAVNRADEVAGVVVDDNGNYIWMKGNKRLKNQIMAIQGETISEEESSLAICLDTMLEYEGVSRNTEYLLEKGNTVLEILQDNLEASTILDLSGCSLDAMLYYVNQDIPVLVTFKDGSAVLLIGFNEMNTVLMNPKEANPVYKMGMNDSREWFEQNGNKFITYMKNADD